MDVRAEDLTTMAYDCPIDKSFIQERRSHWISILTQTAAEQRTDQGAVVRRLSDGHSPVRLRGHKRSRQTSTSNDLASMPERSMWSNFRDSSRLCPWSGTVVAV